MSMQQFCLRWNNHQPNFISVFSNLLTNETLVDVTLAAEGRQIQAHKVVLSACSTYFQSLFTMNPCQHPIVILKDIKFSDLKIMVDFMYYGEVNISQDQLPSIIKTAESLKIKGLAEMHTASLTKWPSGSSETGGGDRGESCSPSPSPLSPSFRRKRLRKSSTGSTSGSGDKPEEINEITLVATNIVKPEPLIVSQDSGENLRRPVNTSTESQGSIDEDQISIMSNMETSSANTPAQSDGSLQDVSQQSAGNIGQSSVSSQPSTHQALHCKQTQVTKRTRLLIRQPRVKKEPSHLSPDGEAGPSPHIVSTSIHLATPTLNLPQTSRSFEESRISPPPHTMLVSHQPNLLTVTTSSNLLTVPQPSYLTKQHSHPLLSTQQPSTSGTYWIHRQHSHPDPLPGRTTSPSIVIEPAPVLKTEEEGYEETSVPILSGTVSEPGTSGISSGGISGGLRVKTTELRRASSSPQSSSSSREPRESAGDQRLGHCPVLRQGPALGCNHCWNTVDDRGRILRRKTKYHCPECQINLCIVPCFQEFHEQQRELNSKLKPLPKTSSV
ncbi:Longitudinals lacking protein, isoforms F/I/K/T [Ooceraea biroi]|uniref:Longitudinals lacking protein, isoforms F/I/K/T n=1 Tax=Ooceraea biroi TaxID=2015173 RepID=A0A026VX07_OOCBI|nr:Longitudinals lacking protein, isoforms F/I/K/T [Ooceraea biroi]